MSEPKRPITFHPYGPHPYRYPAAWGEARLPSPALDLRHAGHARLMDSEVGPGRAGEVRGYAPGLGPE